MIDLSTDLDLAERYVAHGAFVLQRQRTLIASLSARGEDVSSARQLLYALEAVQNSYISDRDRLRVLFDAATVDSATAQAA